MFIRFIVMYSTILFIGCTPADPEPNNAANTDADIISLTAAQENKTVDLEKELAEASELTELTVSETMSTELIDAKIATESDLLERARLSKEEQEAALLKAAQLQKENNVVKPQASK